MGAIWCHYVINKNKEIAKTIWSEHIQGRENVYYYPIIAKANSENDEAMVHELIDCLKSPGGPNLDSAHNTLLEIYIRKNLLDEALKVVEIVKAESGKFNRKTLVELRAALDAEGRDFPYKIPSKLRKVVLTELSDDTNKTDSEQTTEFKISTSDLSPPDGFIKIIRKGSSAHVRNAYQQLSDPDLVEALYKISNGDNALPSLFDALATSGNIQAVEKVNSLLPEPNQNGSWYRNSLAKAYGTSRKGQQWIDEWNKKLDETNSDEELEALGSSFPVAGFYSLLKDNPKLFNQCKSLLSSGVYQQLLILCLTLNSGEALAQRYAEKNISNPMGAIWCHHVMTKNKEAAQNLWSQYIKSREYVYYLPIIGKANKDNNEVLAQELIDYLKTSEAERVNFETAYNTLLSIYVRKSQFDAALEVVETMKARSGKIHRITLVLLKNGLKAEEKKFPYKIPFKGDKVLLI